MDRFLKLARRLSGAGLLTLLSLAALGAEGPGTVTAEGVARLERAPEEALLTLAIVRSEGTAEAALAAASEALGTLQDALAASPIPHTLFNRATAVTPAYRYPREGSRELTHYEARLGLEIQTPALTELGTLLTLANGAGANTVEGIRYALADPLGHRLEALELATKRARATAQTLAAAADHQLGALLTLEADPESRATPFPEGPMMRAMAMDAQGPSLTPAPLTIEARVRVRYALVP